MRVMIAILSLALIAPVAVGNDCSPFGDDGATYDPFGPSVAPARKAVNTSTRGPCPCGPNCECPHCEGTEPECRCNDSAPAPRPVSYWRPRPALWLNAPAPAPSRSSNANITNITPPARSGRMTTRSAARPIAPPPQAPPPQAPPPAAIVSC
jgi:hypothetical protein